MLVGAEKVVFSVVTWTAFGLAEASQATAFDDDVNACWVTLAELKVKTPALLPVIQTTDPSSPLLIESWSLPVALATSAFPITTFPEPLVILLPAKYPKATLPLPVTKDNYLIAK